MTWNKGKGKGIAFLNALIGHDGDDCVTWPYSRDQQGRGRFGHNGRMLQAHAFLCAMVHGPAPSPIHQAAHSCGKGHEACVNPNHLSWKTPAENAKDMIRHGTAKKSGGSRYKLTSEQVVEIRALKGKKTYREIAGLYGVAWETIGDLMRGRTHTGEPQRHGRLISPQQRFDLAQRAKAMRLDGKNYYEIGAALGVSRPTARNYVEDRHTRRSSGA